MAEVRPMIRPAALGGGRLSGKILALTIGFVLLNTLEDALASRGMRPAVAALVTRTLVDPADPGFTAPSKPIGRYLPADEAATMIAHG